MSYTDMTEAEGTFLEKAEEFEKKVIAHGKITNELRKEFCLLLEERDLADLDNTDDFQDAFYDIYREIRRELNGDFHKRSNAKKYDFWINSSC